MHRGPDVPGEAALLLEVDQLIDTASRLEPLPTSAVRLATLATHPDADFREILAVIQLDPALTLRVLRTANSAALGARGRIRTVHEAVLRLGTGAVLSAVVAASVRRPLLQSLPAYGMGEGMLWRHSVAAALAVDRIAHKSSRSLPHETMTVALLHDCGKMVLAQYLTAEVLRLLDSARAQAGLADHESESQLLDVHHGELGAVIAQHWGLPASIVSGIQYHHTPQNADPIEERLTVAHAVHLADTVAKRAGTGLVTDLAAGEDVLASLAYLGVPPECLCELITATMVGLDELIARYAA